MKVQNLIGALLGAFLACASAPALPAPDLESRITSARDELRELANERPEENVRAVAFLVSHMSLEDIRVHLTNWRSVQIFGFRHSTPSRSGGYTFSPTETVDQAISNYRRDHAKFSRERVEMERRATASESDERLREALQRSIRHGEVQIAEAESAGPRIVGVEIEGSARALIALEKAAGLIRVIELSRPGRPQPAITPHPTPNQR